MSRQPHIFNERGRGEKVQALMQVLSQKWTTLLNSLILISLDFAVLSRSNVQSNLTSYNRDSLINRQNRAWQGYATWRLKCKISIIPTLTLLSPLLLPGGGGFRTPSNFAKYMNRFHADFSYYRSIY